MGKFDARQLNHKALTELRKSGVASVQEGQSPEIVAKALGIDRVTIYGWLSRYRQGGMDAIDAKKRGGRKPKLDGKLLLWLYQTLTYKTPLQFNSYFWTPKLVGHILHKRFGIKLSPASICRLLGKLGLAPPPAGHANQQGAENVQTWFKDKYPLLKRRVIQEKALIYFVFDKQVCPDCLMLKGTTQIINNYLKQHELYLISIVGTRRKFRFMLVEGQNNLNAYFTSVRNGIRDEDHGRKIYVLFDSQSKILSYNVERVKYPFDLEIINNDLKVEGYFTEKEGTIHPGTILKEGFLNARGLNANALAVKINVHPQQIYEIINRKRSITPILALKLAVYFRTSKYFWYELQSKYAFAEAQKKFGAKILNEVARIPTQLPVCHAKKHIIYTENKGGFIEETKSIHPGIILKEDFLKTSGLSPSALGLKIHVPSQRLYDIINCRQSITPNLALRLAYYFRTSKYFWYELQSKYDFAKAKKKFGGTIQKEVASGPRKSTQKDFLKIKQKALQVFESEGAMNEWFTSKIKALGGQTPTNLCGTKKNVRIVLEELERLRIKYGTIQEKLPHDLIYKRSRHQI